MFRPPCRWIYYIKPIKIIRFLSKFTIKMEIIKVTNIRQINIFKVGRYFTIEKAAILFVFRFHFYARSVSTTNIAQHDHRRHYKQSLNRQPTAKLDSKLQWTHISPSYSDLSKSVLVTHVCPLKQSTQKCKINIVSFS